MQSANLLMQLDFNYISQTKDSRSVCYLIETEQKLKLFFLMRSSEVTQHQQQLTAVGDISPFHLLPTVISPHLS